MLDNRDSISSSTQVHRCGLDVPGWPLKVFLPIERKREINDSITNVRWRITILLDDQVKQRVGIVSCSVGGVKCRSKQKESSSLPSVAKVCRSGGKGIYRWMSIKQ